MSIEG
jgi:MFS family permease